MIRNDIEVTVNNFLGGKLQSEEVIQYVLSIMFRYEENKKLDYKQLLEQAKICLSLAERRMTNDIIYIKTKEPVPDEIQIVMVRYINVCKDAQFIIVINEEIKFIPIDLRKYSREDIDKHVNKNKTPHLKLVNQASLERIFFKRVGFN